MATYWLGEIDIVRRKGGWKECTNYQTISVVLHVSMLKGLWKGFKRKQCE